MTIEERIKQLREAETRLSEQISRAMTDATIRAVEKAAELTPPTARDLRGTNTRSGALKQHWATDSRPAPVRKGRTYATLLANGMQYASYVNDGHRMDRHFVPGLVINPESGLLEYNPYGKGGIVVGTRTPYVKGLFMVEAAVEEYRRTLRTELGKVREVLE